jgi:hypothetical protein
MHYVCEIKGLGARAIKTRVAAQSIWECSVWWYGRFYLPCRVASIFIRRFPLVYGSPSDLVGRLHEVNLIALTAMCRVMTKCGSDKGSGRHNYTAVYAKLFEGLRGRALRIFEIGIGTNNPQFVFNMGADGVPGASLRGWREIFPLALVYGADLDRDILFTEDRIQTFYCDQLDSNAIRALWAQPAMQGGMDIVVDDGLHTFEANATFLSGSLEHLRHGGFYVVEDIKTADFANWKEQLPSYASRFPNCDFALVELAHRFNDYDNNLLIIQRRI